MNKKLLLASVSLTTLLSITACVKNPSAQSGYGNNNQVQNNSTRSTLSPQLANSIQYMYNEERLAKDIYLDIYKTQPLKQLYNIATKAETKHIEAVNQLAAKYGLDTGSYPNGKYPEQELQSLYNKLYSKGIRSKKDALEVGCMVEVVDIDDLNKYMGQAQASNAQDVLSTFNYLRKGSYNHYWAFDKGLKEIGVTNGCCSLGQAYCHPEYPQNSKGSNRGQGRGQGQNRGQH